MNVLHEQLQKIKKINLTRLLLGLIVYLFGAFMVGLGIGLKADGTSIGVFMLVVILGSIVTISAFERT